MDLDDGSLWDAVQRGDADAFGLLFERHATAIYNFCFRRVGDWSAAPRFGARAGQGRPARLD